MCFSATASFSAGAGLSAAGVLTLSRVKRRADVPFASIPLLFGIQQTIEGVVWISFGAPALNAAVAFAYAIFSHVLWPIFTPLAVLSIERDVKRRRILYACALSGLVAGSYLLYLIIMHGVSASIIHDSIAYDIAYAYQIPAMALYLIATCGSCLVSSRSTVRAFGVALIISFVTAWWFFHETFFSVWCFFAAILSLFAYRHVSRSAAGATAGK